MSSEQNKTKPSQTNPNDHWGKMNDQFTEFFSDCQPDTKKEHDQNGKFNFREKSCGL